MANNFTNDSSVIALYRFENGALTADSISANTLTASASPPTADVVNFKEGLSSADFSGSTQYFKITDANLSAGFPLKNGDATKKMTICFRIRINSSDGSYRAIITKSKYAAGSGNTSFYLTVRSGTIYLGWGLPSSPYYHQTAILTPDTGQWWYIGIVIDGVAKTVYARLFQYNIPNSGGALDYESSYSESAEIVVTNHDFCIGTWHDDNTKCPDINLDELVIFNRCLSRKELDHIRDGSYGSDLVDVNVWFLSSDEQYLAIHNWLGTIGGPEGFTTVYPYQLTTPISQPNLGHAHKDGINIAGFIGFVSGYPNIKMGALLKIFNEETLIRSVFVPPPSGCVTMEPPATGSWILIDRNDYIHVLGLTKSNGTPATYTLYDAISADQGQNWTHVQISTYDFGSGAGQAMGIHEDSSGDIYAWISSSNSNIYISNNSGTSWTIRKSDAGLVESIEWLGGMVFRRCMVANDLQLYATRDLDNWGDPVLTIYGASSYTTNAISGSAMTYDGTYAYLIVAQFVPDDLTWEFGYQEGNLYRSTDGITWEKTATTPPFCMNASNPFTFDVDGNGRLYFSGWEFTDYTDEDSRYISFMYSDDQGENWTIVRSPWSDLILGNYDDSYLSYFTCPSGMFVMDDLDFPDLPIPLAICLGTSGVTIDPLSFIISGIGTGENGTQWRLIRLDDSVVMDSGSGLSADFSFIGEYNVDYQLQFAGSDNVFSTTGCTFNFPKSYKRSIEYFDRQFLSELENDPMEPEVPEGFSYKRSIEYFDKIFNF
jgi:hypothetical protein